MTLRLLRAFAVISLLLAPVALIVLVFGGPRVSACLSSFGCTPPPEDPLPLIGTKAGVMMLTGALVVTWIVLVGTLVAAVARSEPHRLRRIVVRAAQAAAVAGLLGAGYGRLTTGRIRGAFTEGLALAIAVLVIGVWLGTVRAVWDWSDA